jgi:hypothetical protein
LPLRPQRCCICALERDRSHPIAAVPTQPSVTFPVRPCSQIHKLRYERLALICVKCRAARMGQVVELGPCVYLGCGRSLRLFPHSIKDDHWSLGDNPSRPKAWAAYEDGLFQCDRQ